MLVARARKLIPAALLCCGTMICAHAESATASDDTRYCTVFELRQYSLRSGQRDVLIELFDREFVESQEAAGMKIYGQFRDGERPDRFVWIRGFADMETRARALKSFYQGPVWKSYGRQAAGTMVDSDDVLLLRAVEPGESFDGLPDSRPSVDAPAPSSIVVATIYPLRRDAPDTFTRFFDHRIRPALRDAGIVVRAAFRSEHAPNTYPALPVREGEEVFVWLASFATRAEYKQRFEQLSRSQSWTKAQSALASYLTSSPEELKLLPTARSLLR
jgi:NIPSNAP